MTLTPDIEQRVKDTFSKIVFKYKNINASQQGEVYFDFGNSNKTTIQTKITNQDGTIPGSLIEDGTIDADIKIAERSIAEANIKLGALTSELIAQGAITETKISDDSISTPKLKTNSITSDKIGAGQIEAIHLTTSSAVITGTAQIANAIIIESHIQDLAVTNAKISNLAVTNEKINDLQVDKLKSGTIASQNIILNGTGYIRSSNYSTGNNGFTINSDGNCEFNNITARGTFTITGGSGIDKFTDAGDLATKNRSDLNYTDGADVTGDNTANDTKSVNGLSASVVHGWAYTNDTTYIDGGKLYTGTVVADYVKANISISSPTITGGTLQTATSGQRVIIDGANNHIQFYNSNGDDAGYLYGHTYNVNGTTGNAITSSGALSAHGPIACSGGFITNGNSRFENNDNDNPTLKIKNDGSGATIEAYGDNDSSVIYASNNNSDGYSIYGAGYVGGDNLYFDNYLATAYGYLYSSSDGHLHWHNNTDGSDTQIV